ncbi:MAG TPA: efflux RND transporter periplasmic adaptor subunit [Thermoanaerobaculia bacterium]|nr:efflux RND transporter periplasmic adaptor subunit [Thermoanaerobaculia bacterium]
MIRMLHGFRSRLSPRSRVAVVLLSLPLAGAGGCHRAEEHSAEPLPPVRAELAVAERRIVPERLELQGVVEAEQRSAIATRVMAAVTAVYVDVGDVVRRGQSLVEVAPQMTESGVAQAQGALAQAESALALARRNHERYRALAEVDAASELELDVARMQQEQAEGAVEQARAALAGARDLAGDTRLVAPFAGRVASRMADVGDLAAPGRPLVVIESAASRRLVLAVPESVLARSSPAVGDLLPVSLDARPGATLEGRVVLIAAGADPGTHAVRVEVELTGPSGSEVPTGSAARAWLETGAREIVLVPRAVVMTRGGLELIAVVTPEGLTSTRVVTTGAEFDDSVEILSGLDGGESLIVGLAAPPPAGSPIEGAPGR